MFYIKSYIYKKFKFINIILKKKIKNYFFQLLVIFSAERIPK
jgi:hypothetical protein